MIFAWAFYAKIRLCGEGGDRGPNLPKKPVYRREGQGLDRGI
jgi:hypothetical protein